MRDAPHGSRETPFEKQRPSGLPALLPLIDKTHPIPKQFRANLSRDVAELSRQLTSGRTERPDNYLSRPAMLSAYLRYFLPWNIFRLCQLLPALPLELREEDTVIDLGSGPLTLPIALFLSRPDLHEKKLALHCVDQNAAALDAGKQLFNALAGENHRWTIHTVRADAGRGLSSGYSHQKHPLPKAGLVTAVNLYNELYQKIPQADRAAEADLAQKTASRIAGRLACDGAALVVEPGNPRGGQFIGALRAALFEKNLAAAAPCPHEKPCPLPGGKKGTKWCHFVLDTRGAPPELQRLSATAGLAKDQVTFSYIYAENRAAARKKDAEHGIIEPGKTLAVRVISEPFPLPAGLWGRYGCSEKGLTLVSGRQPYIEEQTPGVLLRAALPERERRDEKTGAFVVSPPASWRR